MYKHLCILIISILLISCGFKGPLYLQPNTPAEQQPSNNKNNAPINNTTESGEIPSSSK